MPVQLQDVYQRLRETKPPLVYLSGKTCTGKSTFANKLKETAGYAVVDLDSVVFESVIRPLGLTDEGNAFLQVYRDDPKHEWVELFVAAARDAIGNLRRQGRAVVVDGALANTRTLAAILDGCSGIACIYFHPAGLAAYTRNITGRFTLATKDFSSGLPGAFWELIDRQEFDAFCTSRVLTPGLGSSIARYARLSRTESTKRLRAFRAAFPDITVVHI